MAYLKIIVSVLIVMMPLLIVRIIINLMNKQRGDQDESDRNSSV